MAAPIKTTNPLPCQFWARAEHYITQGKPVEFRMEMTVCDLHQLWDDLWSRGNRIAGALNRYADKLRQRAASQPRNEKIRLNQRAGDYSDRARAISALVESRYAEAQEKLSATLPLSDELRECFFDDIGQRPGIEQTWGMTLQAVANHLQATGEPGGRPQGPPRVKVDAVRLDCGLWLPQGDITAAMSLEAELSKGKIRTVKTFKHDGGLWTVLGMGYCQFRNVADAYPLIPEAEYLGPTEKVPYSHEGEPCNYKGTTFRLGPKHEFVAGDRPVAHWQKLFRIQYEQGGYFTADKTYHEVLVERAGKEHWDADQTAYVHGSTIAPNFFKAVELELAEPDYSKWPTVPVEANIETCQALEQMALAFA